MGSGARAYRMAVGQEAAALETQLAFLKAESAESEEVPDIFAEQQQQIFEKLAEIKQPGLVRTIETAQPAVSGIKKENVIILVISGIVLLWLIR